MTEDFTWKSFQKKITGAQKIRDDKRFYMQKILKKNYRSTQNKFTKSKEPYKYEIIKHNNIFFHTLSQF